MLQHALEVKLYRSVMIRGYAADLGVGGLAEVALVIEIDQLFALVIIEEQALGVEQASGHCIPADCVTP